MQFVAKQIKVITNKFQLKLQIMTKKNFSSTEYNKTTVHKKTYKIKRRKESWKIV